MKVVNVDKNIIRDLRQSGLSAKMKSLEYCKFLVIEEDKGKIIGAGGIGSFFNIQSLQVLDEYKGKGIGKKLFVELLEEEKRRGYSFSLGSRNPENNPMVKLGDLTGRYVLFRIHYSPGITRDVNIVVLRKRGKIVAKFNRRRDGRFIDGPFPRFVIASISREVKNSGQPGNSPRQLQAPVSYGVQFSAWSQLRFQVLLELLEQGQSRRR